MAEYDSIDDAANAALSVINKAKDSTEREYIGLVYQDPATGKYLFTPPQSKTSKRTKDKAKGTFTIPKGSVRAIIHNHPYGIKNRYRERLSEEDVAVAQQLGVPSYIGVGNKLMRWNPQDGRTRGRHGLPEEVLAQIDTDQLPDKRRILMARQKAAAPVGGK